MIKDLSAVYTGTQLQAAGILFLCPSTKNVLVILRSASVTEPTTWCGVGGKVEDGETSEQAALREAKEEVGFEGPIDLRPAYAFSSDTLSFQNYIGVVNAEFTPTLNWESSGYAWVPLDKIPQPTHFGLQALLADKDSKELLDAFTTETVTAKTHSVKRK